MRVLEGREPGKTKENKGYTLVELVVSMALTAIFATAVASMMFPVVSTFMNMQRLSRAQMVADTVTDALRRECASAYVTGVADVRVLNLPEGADYTAGDSGLPTELAKTENLGNESSGNTLMYRINEGYAKAIYWNVYVSPADYEAVRNTDQNLKMSDVTSKAVYRLFPDQISGISKEDDMPMETRPGYLHCAYYTVTASTVAHNGESIDVFTPGAAYDYTNPFSAAAYNGFTVSVTFSDLAYETVVDGSELTADKRPVYVVANVRVYDSDFEGQSAETLVCSRRAVLCFSEDNRRQ